MTHKIVNVRKSTRVVKPRVAKTAVEIDRDAALAKLAEAEKLIREARRALARITS